MNQDLLDLSNGIFTLKKISFTESINKFGLTLDDLKLILILVLNISESSAVNILHQKIEHYNESTVKNIKLLLEYILT